jgi:hypothetical protein
MKIEIPSHIDATWLVVIVAAFVIAVVYLRKAMERLRKEVEGVREEIENIKSQLPGKRLYDAACDGKVAEVSNVDVVVFESSRVCSPHLTHTSTPPYPLPSSPPSPILKMAGEDPLQRMGWQRCCPQLEEYKWLDTPQYSLWL